MEPELLTTEPTSIPDPGIPAPTSTDSFWLRSPSTFLHSHRTTPNLPASAHTVIIGSGVAGSMLYNHLSSLSPAAEILMLEARDTCFGATGRNGGHCKPMLYQASDYLSLCQAIGEAETLRRIRFERLNLRLIAEYVKAEEVQCDWVEGLSVDVYYHRQPFQLAKENIAALAKAAPDIVDELRVVEDRAELRERIRTPTAVGAVEFRAGRLWPYKLVSHVLEKGVKVGRLNLQTTTPVTEVSRASDERWEVRTARGVVAAERVVFATNAHTAHLLPVFRGWIYPVRGQMAALVPPRSLLENPLTHTYGLVREDRKTACYLIQRPIDDDGGGGELMLGGGRQLEEGRGVGLQDDAINEVVARGLRTSIAEFFSAETGWEEELGKSFIEKFRRLRLSAGHDVRDAAVHGVASGEILYDTEKKVRGSLMHGKECKAKMEWSGTMGFSRDGRPFVGRVPAVGQGDARRLGISPMKETKGLYMLAGFEGHGMAYSSGSAKALATMMVADEKDVACMDLYAWFPRTFEVTASRLGLVRLGDGWEKVGDDDWEIVDSPAADIDSPAAEIES